MQQHTEANTILTQANTILTQANKTLTQANKTLMEGNKTLMEANKTLMETNASVEERMSAVVQEEQKTRALLDKVVLIVKTFGNTKIKHAVSCSSLRLWLLLNSTYLQRLLGQCHDGDC